MSDIDEVEEGNSTNNGGNNGFWLGIIIGGLIGAAVAYLATDDKSQLRKTLLKKGKILLDNLEDFKDDAEKQGKKIEKQVVAKIEDVKEEVQDRVEEIPDTVTEAVVKVQQAANTEIAKIVNAADKVENQAHKQARKFFLSKGKPLMKK